jgi:hypothetical protein
MRNEQGVTTGPISEWDVLFVLPNLNLEDADPRELAELTLHSEFMAIVPSTDKRVLAFAERAPAAKVLLNGFSDSLGSHLVPAVTIIRRDAPASIQRNAEATFAFRNSVALGHLLRARAKSHGWGGGGQVWSDIWDIHPTTVNRRGTGLITDSPAVTGSWPQPTRYYAMPSDALSRNVRLRLPDDHLLHVFGQAWRERFLDQIDKRRTRVLFRSLETAYQASSVGGRHYGSLYEFGISTAWWVSAIEILAAPPPTRRKYRLQPGEKRRKKATRDVQLTDVLNLLSHYQWFETRLRRTKGTAKFGRVNLIQRVYLKMYKARSRFLHGDRVSTNLLYFHGKQTPSLDRLASYVYWTALRGFVDRYYDVPIGVGLFVGSDMERGLLLEFEEAANEVD